jgi:hypothetical protein
MASDARLAAGLQGGVAPDPGMGVVGADTAALASAQAAAETAENRRRRIASMSPGLGVLLALPQPDAGPAVGKPGLGIVTGEGYEVQAEITEATAKSYGPPRPQYAAPEVAGIDYPLGIAQPSMRFGVSPGTVVVSPPAPKPGLWSRLVGRLRGRG